MLVEEPLVTADGEPWPAMRLKRSFRGHQLRHHPVGGRAIFRRSEQVAIDWQHSENTATDYHDGSLETVVVATDQRPGQTPGGEDRPGPRSNRRRWEGTRATMRATSRSFPRKPGAAGHHSGSDSHGHDYHLRPTCRKPPQPYRERDGKSPTRTDAGRCVGHPSPFSVQRAGLDRAYRPCQQISN